MTLWGVLKFNAHRFVRLMTSTAEFQGMLRTTPEIGAQADMTFLPESIASQAPTVLADLKRECDASLLFFASDLIEDQLEALRLSEGRITLSQMFRFDAELNKRIEHELKRRKFYQLKPELAPLFEDDRPFGDSVFDSFPSARHDLREACRSFACERYDATVYHLSRALEVPLKCLSASLRIKYSPGWAAYIKRIDKQLQNTTIRISGRRRSFLSNASVLLWSVKDAWRNDVVHAGTCYGPDQTRQIFDSTKALMQHFAGGLKEKARR